MLNYGYTRTVKLTIDIALSVFTLSVCLYVFVCVHICVSACAGQGLTLVVYYKCCTP